MHILPVRIRSWRAISVEKFMTTKTLAILSGILLVAGASFAQQDAGIKRLLRSGDVEMNSTAISGGKAIVVSEPAHIAAGSDISSKVKSIIVDKVAHAGDSEFQKTWLPANFRLDAAELVTEIQSILPTLDPIRRPPFRTVTEDSVETIRVKPGRVEFKT